MPILRLAYVALFLIALVALFAVWSQVGGQSHLDLMPWYCKLALGAGVAFALVRATAAAVGHPSLWNASTLRWTGILLACLLGCAALTYYVHMYGEEDDSTDEDEQTTTSSAATGYRQPLHRAGNAH